MKKAFASLFLVALNLGNSTTFIKNNAEADAHVRSVGTWLRVMKEVFLGPKATISSRRYPAFFLYVAKKLKCYTPCLGIWRKKVIVMGYQNNILRIKSKSLKPKI